MFSHDLHAYVRALMGADAVRVGPFLLAVDDHDDGLFRNYAVPDDDTGADTATIADLVAAFEARARTPRLEFLPEPGSPGQGPAVWGAGLCAPPHHGVSELAAVGVRDAYRRRGIAAAVTAHLTRIGPEVGVHRPFLTPAAEAEERIYHRVGFRTATTMLHVSRPASGG